MDDYEEEYAAAPVRSIGKEPAPKLPPLIAVDHPVASSSTPPVPLLSRAAERPKQVVGRRATEPPRRLDLREYLGEKPLGALEASSEAAGAHLLGLNVLLIPVVSYAGYRLGGFYGAVSGTFAGGAALNFVRAAWSDGHERNVSIAYGVVGAAVAGYTAHLASKKR